MQSEEFDKKIIEAADHHHPAYDEQAWNRMEKLLNKHLPQKEDGRRRGIFFLLLLLVLGGSAWLFISQPWKEHEKIGETKQVAEEPSPVTATQNSNTSQQENTSGEPTTTNPVTGSTVNAIVPVNTAGIPEQKEKTVMMSGGGKKVSSKPGVLPVSDHNNVAGTKMIVEPKDEKIVSPVKTNNNDPVVNTNTVGKNNTTVGNTIPPANNAASQLTKQVNAENTIPVKDAVVKKTKTAGKKTNSFFFTLSGGADISILGSSKPGKIKLLGGAGLGYTFKDRFTVRTGFYTGRKVYSASPGEYHAPSEFWTYYPYLESVDANCKVYEIPLSLSYNFGRSAKAHWFATTGLSSYLMKSETYTYFYKTSPTSPTINRQWTLLDKNKHYFSVLTLSGGYEHNISKNISLMVEPYMKLPLSGIGYGKVKLNSGGLLFSVGIRPFNNAKDRYKLNKVK